MGSVKYYFKYLKVFFIGLLLISFSLNAAAQDDCSFDPNCEVDPDEEVPLDSGVVYLVAIGLTYAIILIHKNKVKANNRLVRIEDDNG